MAQLTEEHSKAINGHKCIFPQAETFGDLFERWEPCKYQPGRKVPERMRPHVEKFKDYRGRPAEMYIGPYCQVRDGESLDVKPRPEVIQAILGHLLHVEWDTITFAVTRWDDGRALVSASHGQIIGSVWLSIIDGATVPKGA